MNLQNRFKDVSIETVKNFWNRQPCNLRHSPNPVGTKEYFDEVEARKYFIEPHILKFADFRLWKGKKVLEIGCGIGTDTINFSRAGAVVTAVELSEKSLEIAKRRAEIYGFKDRIRFYGGNAEELNQFLPREPYDLVYSFGVIHHVPQPERIIRQICRYLHSESVVKIMVYHRYAWKVFWILFKYGKGRFWQLSEVVARYSEAQTQCPVTHIFNRHQIRNLLERHNLVVTNIQVEHIFPYKISDYVQYRYRKVWYFRWMPRPFFRWLERHFGWHLLITSRPNGSLCGN